MSDLQAHRIVDGEGPWLRRRIVVWRRLEPGDVRSPGSLEAPESPFLEAKVLEIALPRAFHAEMQRLAALRAQTSSLESAPLTDYEPAGVMIAAAGGMAVGVWLEYLRPRAGFLVASALLFVLGVVLAIVAKHRRGRALAAAASRWAAEPEREAYEALARTLDEGWQRFARAQRTEGFHVEIRVAEGSNDPLRLASIDPRPMQNASGFDPEDWMPSEGEGVRYEALHAAGEIATRAMPGTSEVEAS